MESSEHASSIKDPKRIDVDDPREVVAWCTLLKLSEADLRTAVGIIGPMSAAVAVYVNSRGRRGVSRQVGEIGHPFERRSEPRPELRPELRPFEARNEETGCAPLAPDPIVRTEGK